MILWTTRSDPQTFKNIGMEAVAMLCTNIICFIDLKTKSKSYYIADGPTRGAGISNFAGHNRFPIFAFSEAILQPSIFVMQYPELIMTCKFPAKSKNVIAPSYIDLCFAEFDHLVALTGYPNYYLRVWNYRTGQFLTEIETNTRCSQYCLRCTSNNMPKIAQFSEWSKTITFWEICIQSESVDLHEISLVNIPKKFNFSLKNSYVFGDCGRLFIVDDYGVLYTVEVAQFYMKRQWGTIFEHHYSKPIKHCLYSSKNGFMIANPKSVYFLKKHQNLWVIEWVIDKPNHGIVKMLSNINGEIYCVNKVGNIYQIDTSKTDKLAEFSCTNDYIVDYVRPQGIKEESLVMLTINSELVAIDVLRQTIFSRLEIEKGTVIQAHSSLPNVVVGTEKGHILFISYEKIRSPVIICDIVADQFPITDLQLSESAALSVNIFLSATMLIADFKEEKFAVLAKSNPRRIVKINIFLIDATCTCAFVSYDKSETDFYATELWVSNWLHSEKKIRRVTFELPHKYYRTALLNVSDKNKLQFCATRWNDYVIDILVLIKNVSLTLNMTIRTNHHALINSLFGTRNIITIGVASCNFHFYSHKKSSKPLMITRNLELSHTPRLLKKAEDCFNTKYILFLSYHGTLIVQKMPQLTDNLKENVDVTILPPLVVLPSADITIDVVQQARKLTIFVPTTAEVEKRESLVMRLKALEGRISELIQYDISVTGKEKGIFRKFCLNYRWLEMLDEQARILFDVERKSMLASIEDQTRVREWIYNYITSTCKSIGVKIRAIFSNALFENYSEIKTFPHYLDDFDWYRLYDFEMQDEDEDDEVNTEAALAVQMAAQAENSDEEEEELPVPVVIKTKKKLKRFVVKGSAFEHFSNEQFSMQDKNIVTSNQVYNENCKVKIILIDALKAEFNKKYVELTKFKQEIMDNVVNTNSTLDKIYSNMNCMLCLLKMDTFIPDKLSVPKWMDDEILERILTVDDSEIKAVNRRKKKAEVTAHKGGRMLLWTVEFWIKALNIMMDGVLEKLWEEEIKKTPPLPEFMTKKEPHEFSLEDQKQLREYEEKLRLLELDRHKYLRILNDNERKTHDLKKTYIMKLNEQVSKMAVEKLKYDFIVKINRIRLINLKIKHLKCQSYRNKLEELRVDQNRVQEYIGRYNKLVDFWEKAISDVKERMELKQQRDKALDRQFKAQYLNTIPTHFGPEMKKLFRKRPKLIQRFFNSTLICMEVASKLLQQHRRNSFPLPSEVLDYLKHLEILDDPSNAPNQMDSKHWDAFVRLRRQKLESELRLRGAGLQLADAQETLKAFINDVSKLKRTKEDINIEMDRMFTDMIDFTQNQHLQITLDMGQLEVHSGGNMVNIMNSILMNMDDINMVNDLIKKAGQKKLRTMQKLAQFRRQVIFKEWEHKVYRANIDYLKYMLEVIEKCKVTMEFLHVLRNWKRVQQTSQQATSTVGILERAIEEKIKAFRKNLDRIIDQIDICKEQINETRRKNQMINKQIDEIKVNVAINTVNRDVLVEEKRQREQDERLAKIKMHCNLIQTVRRNHAHILELRTILELQRLRTYPTLGPAPPECI